MNTQTTKGRGRFGSHVGDVVKKFNGIYSKRKKDIDALILSAKKDIRVKDLETRVAFDIARGLKYWDWDFWPKTSGGYIDATDDQLKTLFVQALRKSNIKLDKNEKPTVMRKSTKRSACSSSKRRGGNSTIRMATGLLKEQKKDYQKIFRSEVKKAKDPKEGAKRAGRIYREKYGATAEDRWKKALKRAK